MLIVLLCFKMIIIHIKYELSSQPNWNIFSRSYLFSAPTTETLKKYSENYNLHFCYCDYSGKFHNFISITIVLRTIMPFLNNHSLWQVALGCTVIEIVVLVVKAKLQVSKSGPLSPFFMFPRAHTNCWRFNEFLLQANEHMNFPDVSRF